jgi:hypothetical protein
MKNLLITSFYRLRKEKGYWVALILTSAAAFLIALILGIIHLETVKNGGTDYSGLHAFSTSIFDVLFAEGSGSIANFPIGIIGLFAASSFVSKEWRYHTIRNSILAGKSRIEIYFSLLVMTLGIALSLILAYQIVYWLVGACFQVPFATANELESDPQFSLHFVFSFFSELFIYLMLVIMATAWGFIVQNPWGALGCFFGALLFFYIISIILSFVEALNGANLNALLDFFPAIQVSKFGSHSWATLDSWVIYEKVEGAYGFSQSLETGHLVTTSVISYVSELCYASGLTALGILAFTKRDLK